MAKTTHKNKKVIIFGMITNSSLKDLKVSSSVENISIPWSQEINLDDDIETIQKQQQVYLKNALQEMKKIL